jgi:hypothetical protein
MTDNLPKTLNDTDLPANTANTPDTPTTPPAQPQQASQTLAMQTPPPGESISFQDITVTIKRYPSHETFIALEPPNANPYVTVPLDAKPEEILIFVNQFANEIRELREDMLKHFEKTNSLKCRYQTGDIAYLYGRPFMLRVFPVAKSSGKKVAARGRANVGAVLRHELSVIDLFLVKAGDFDQGKAAFLSLAKPIFERNAASLVEQCMDRVFPEAQKPKHVKSRPLRNDWISIDTTKSTVWISDSLVPYPPECVVYAFLVEMIKIQMPDASETKRIELLNIGLPGWQDLRTLMADPNSIYNNQ